MATAVVMPRIGYEMVRGSVVRWLKREGDSVGRGEPIAEVETDKAIVELAAEQDGTLISIAAPEGATVSVGDIVAYIGEAGEETDDQDPPSAESGAESGAERPQGLRSGFPPRLPGPDGRIPLGRMGQAIARRTQSTMAETPHFYLTVRIDMTDALELRRELNRASRESHVTVNDMVLKACATALVKYPVFNSTFEGDHLRVQPHVNIGIAVALPAGLIVPAVLHCEEKPLAQIARDAVDVAERGRNGTLRQEEYTGTFSVSNLGMFDVDAFTAIVVAPQVAVLAVGAARATPVARGGEVVVRQTMAATLSVDHRAAGGAEAAQFTTEIKRLLEQPRLLVQ